MNEFENYEYVIALKPCGKTRLKKAGLIALYILFVISWLAFGLNTPFPALLALIPLTTWILVFLTWRYSNVEYEYSVASGIVTFSKIFGGRSRKKVFELDLRSVERLIPIKDRDIERILNDYEPKFEISFLSSPDAPDAYLALFAEDDTKCAVRLEILPKMMRSCKLYCPHSAIGGVAFSNATPPQIPLGG